MPIKSYAWHHNSIIRVRHFFLVCFLLLFDSLSELCRGLGFSRGDRERTCWENDDNLFRSSGIRVRPRACAVANMFIFGTRFPTEIFRNRAPMRLRSGLFSPLLSPSVDAILPNSTLEWLWPNFNWDPEPW